MNAMGDLLQRQNLGPGPRCASCNAPLTVDEAKYLENSCNQCERRAYEDGLRAEAGLPQVTRLVLPPALSANRYWRPVKLGKHISIVPTTEAKAYRREVGLLAKSAGVKPIGGRVALTVRMYPARPQDWAKRAAKDPDGWDDSVRSIDLDNALKVLLDALKDIAFNDDSWVRKIDAERCEPDEHGARVEVEIAPIIRQAVAPRLFA